jgi:Right handed beta helix region
MKITALLGIFCLVFLFSCQKDSVNPDTVPAKSTTTHTDTTTIANTGITTIVTPSVPGNNNPTSTTGKTGTTTTTPPATSTTGTTTITPPATSTTGTTTITPPATSTTGTTTTKPTTGTTTTTPPATSTTGTTTTKPTTGTTTTTPPATSTTGTTATTTPVASTIGSGATTTPVASTTGSATTTTTKPATGTTTTKPSTGTTTTTGPVTAPTTKPATGTTTTTPAKPVITTPPATTKPVVKTTPPSTTGDDTKTLQQLLNAGDVTLVAGKTYNITGLSVPHAFNLNGASINMTKSYGAAIRLTATGASISNGTLTGTWSNTTPGDPNGGYGIMMSANNTSVSHISISSFASYGITTSPVNNISVTNCFIANTGYIGFYFDPETALTSGGTFSNNTVDRSMVPASSVQEEGVAIRGSAHNMAITTSNWTISGNTIKMPARPASIDAECMEVRSILNSTISNNTFTAGSIGCSVVEASNITVSGNKLSGSSLEAIEFADCKTSASLNNVITSSLNVGELIDGGVGSNGITITNDVISGTTAECIHTYLGTQNVTITGCTLSAPKGASAINLQATTNVKIVNTIFNGNSVATEAIILDTCPGNLTINGGSISNFKSCVIAIYNVKAGLTTNNVTMTGVKVTGVVRALSSDVENGAILGSNIIVVNH